jgi:hypothetical protein
MTKKVIDDAREVLNEMREECECQGKYCPLEFLVMLILTDPRLDAQRILEQHKCVEKFKYEESEKVRRDIGWEEAYKLWADRGYAARFDKIYKEGMHHPKEIYDKVISPDNQVKPSSQLTL